MPLAAGAEKIEHLVILMMENRSFDHYLGSLANDPDYPHAATVEGLAGALQVNRNDAGEAIDPWELKEKWFGYDDLPHGPGPQTNNYHGGALDGFVKSSQHQLAHDHRDWTAAKVAEEARIAMGYYTRTSLPVLYALADNFTVCDHWFSSMLSSTWPNRKYLHSGKRDGDDDTHTLPAFPGFGTRPFVDFLENTVTAGKRNTWKSYFTDLPFLAFWYKFAAFHIRNFQSVESFVADCREDSLPTVSIVDPAFSLADDHPTHDVRLGQKFLGLMVDALTHSEAWSKTALIITYDENGGFFDHVVPPNPFEANPRDTPLGFRVPTLVISPYSPSGVCKKVFDHTSIMKSIALRWGIDFPDADFGDRWRNAPDIWSECFNFNQEPKPMGTYTGGEPPYKSFTWENGVHELMTNPMGDLEGLLARIFLLPELKLLDNRHGLFNTLNAMETAVVNLKRML